MIVQIKSLITISPLTLSLRVACFCIFPFIFYKILLIVLIAW